MTRRSTPNPKPDPSAARGALPVSATGEPWSSLAGLAEELTVHVDATTGSVTRLTRFAPGTDAAALPTGGRADPEAMVVVAGRLYDAARERWIEAGEVVDRAPGEAGASFRTDEGCVVLEVSRPDDTQIGPGRAPRRGGEAWPGPGI